MVYNTGLPGFWNFPSSGILKSTTLRKLDLFSSSGEGVGDICSAGSVRNSKPQSLDH
jgi:hypothetical protein